MKQASASSTDHGGGKRRGGTRRAAWIAHGLLLPLSVFGKFAGPIPALRRKIGERGRIHMELQYSDKIVGAPAY